ncbi:hypothetical protein GCM10027168_74520 [Streptomyces capparidis]
MRPGQSRALLAGAALATGALGAALAHPGLGSPLRAPFVLFFLLGAPALAVGAHLRRLDPLTRAVLATAASVLLNLAAAQALLLLGQWAARRDVLAVGALAAALFAAAALRPAVRTGPRPLWLLPAPLAARPGKRSAR